MKLTVTGRKIEITDAIKDHLNKKMEKTIKDLVEKADVHVSLSVEKHRHHVDIALKTKGFSLHSKDETDTLYTAIDGALEKMEKQLRKHHDKKISMKMKKGPEQQNI